ncbi:cytochrome P450 [Clavulina sp. PMI_390]|nr:cytochrome P450 [Clavulina sp. PMI_390]
MNPTVSTSWLSAMVAVIFLALAILVRFRGVARRRNFLPGPSGIPWIGQALEIPTLHTHLYYTQLQKTYGDIYTLTALGQKLIILNTYEVCFDVLAKQGAIHCDRPPNPYITRFLGLEYGVALMNANNDWREGRRLFQMTLNKDASRMHFAEDIAFQARSYVLRGIEHNQDNNNEFLDAALHKIFLQSTYGIALGNDDPLLQTALEATEIASKSLLPTKHLVNLFPNLQHLPAWVPFQTWRTESKEARKVLDPLSEIPWQHVLTSKTEGSASESVAFRCMCEQTKENAHILPTLAGTVLTAGAETTLGVCRLFILAMLLHPEVQKKAQEELDRVVGEGRLPTIDDQPNLPYLDAIVKEVLRWQPVVPFSVPTAPKKADSYGDYYIPHDAVVIQNTWAISRDEEMYPDPESFNPDRWTVADPPRDSRLWNFGIGRRICPGMAYAEVVYTTLFMTLLSTVDILPALDKDGNFESIDLNNLTTGRVVSIPLPFSYRLSPRSKFAVSLLREEVMSV